jgi:hypothetical protein
MYDTTAAGVKKARRIDAHPGRTSCAVAFRAVLALVAPLCGFSCKPFEQHCGAVLRRRTLVYTRNLPLPADQRACVLDERRPVPSHGYSHVQSCHGMHNT